MNTQKIEWFVRSGTTISGPLTEQQTRQKLSSGQLGADAQVRTGTSDWVDVAIVKARFEQLDDNGWYVQAKDGSTLGPYTADRITQHVKSGQLPTTALVRRGKGGNWLVLRDVASRVNKTESTAIPIEKGKLTSGGQSPTSKQAAAVTAQSEPASVLPPALPRAKTYPAAELHHKLHPLAPGMLLTLGLSCVAVFILLVAITVSVLLKTPTAPSVSQSIPPRLGETVPDPVDLPSKSTGSSMDIKSVDPSDASIPATAWIADDDFKQLLSLKFSATPAPLINAKEELSLEAKLMLSMPSEEAVEKLVKAGVKQWTSRIATFEDTTIAFTSAVPLMGPVWDPKKANYYAEAAARQLEATLRFSFKAKVVNKYFLELSDGNKNQYVLVSPAIIGSQYGHLMITGSSIERVRDAMVKIKKLEDL